MFNRKSFLVLVVVIAATVIISNNIVFISKAELRQEKEKEVAALVSTVSDGPYIFIEKDAVNNEHLNAFWLCQGKVVKKRLNKTQIPLKTTACDLPAVVHSLTHQETAVLTYTGSYDVAALSDFHGQYDLMIKLLSNNNIIDEDNNWAFENGHFVITGDIFDRGDKVTEILWFLYDLERQAEQAGGKIHLTLGNHEVMILNGDLRYLHPKYLAAAEKLNKSFEQLFSKESILGNWLRSKPVLVKVNDMLFAHGGFHPDLATDYHSLKEINAVFKQNLIKADLAQPREGFGEYLHRRNGPIWYRGYFADDEGATAAEIELLLKHFNVQHLIVGHTSQKQIETRYNGRVIAIDSSIKRGRYGEILLIEAADDDGKKKMYRGSLTGEKLPLNIN